MLSAMVTAVTERNNVEFVVFIANKAIEKTVFINVTKYYCPHT